MKESDGPAQIGLSLSVPAPDSFTVQIFSQNNNLSGESSMYISLVTYTNLFDFITYKKTILHNYDT